LGQFTFGTKYRDRGADPVLVLAQRSQLLLITGGETYVMTDAEELVTLRAWPFPVSVEPLASSGRIHQAMLDVMRG